MNGSANGGISHGDSEWFQPIPIEEFQKINQLSRENVPKSRPIDDTDKFGSHLITCGPILRLSGTLENQNNYRGSIMLVTKDSPDEAPQLTFKIGPSQKSTNSNFKTGEFLSTKYYEQNGYKFFRYEVNLELAEVEQKVEYFINNSFKKNFQFYIPAVDESMNVISFSCNGFSLACDASEYKSSLWLDVLDKHKDQHYHVMLGGGDQIYCDSIKLHSKKLQEWLKIKNPLKKRHAPAEANVIQEFERYYLQHYMDWFGKGYWKGKNSSVLESLFPITMSQIPSVNIYDDHDIIDGFGSYHDSTMSAPIFASVGNVAYKFYMLFQHQMNPDEKVHLNDPSWVLGPKPGPFIKQKNHSVFMKLGKEISLLGLDCRTERKLKQIVSPDTYKVVFDRLNKEIETQGDTKHLLVMLGVPIFYPRLVWLEWLLTSTVLAPLRKLAAKGVINKGLVNEFDGDVEVLDDLNDHWCSKYHKAERNKLIRDLVEFGSSKGIRITILSGDVHLCCIGRIKSKLHHHETTHKLVKGDDINELNEKILTQPENDPSLIFNVISSAIVNAPPPDAMATLLNSRSGIHRFTSKIEEDIVPIFQDYSNHQFLNKRNWSDLILAKQSVLYRNDVDKGITKYPQPLIVDFKIDEKIDKVDDRHIKYPLYDDSLVTTIRVEKDKDNLKSESVGYEVLIPRLEKAQKIKVSHIKHVDI
ncbi:unnamed protein product [Candida verbasci]|uniref:PhoD-like phosphatase domain-containing protein n=1 Tax=Candida verbasci TaxID=1227364 RepID=A0A9W4XMW7_9ASCO|nr:unnamed protein product [Candida verbasci]